MPRQTFFNLPEEKKDRIIQGAMAVFSTKALNEASVAEIVDQASISRGSFYQYFEDKLDLYLHLIGLFKRNYHNLLMTCFKKNQGDFYASYKSYSRYYIDNITKSKKFGFFEKLYLNMNYALNRESINLMFTDSHKSALYQVVRLDNLKISTKAELLEVLQFLHELLNNSIMEGFWKNAPVEVTQDHFIKRLDWVFYGISRVEKGENC